MWLCDQSPVATGVVSPAAMSLVRERTVASHFGSRSFPARASSATWSRTRRQATGESITRFAHSLMPWASCSMTLSTIFTAIAPFAAARRSSYAARLHWSEHHVAGRPVGRGDGIGAAASGARPTVHPDSLDFRTDETRHASAKGVWHFVLRSE